jgi:hypothetical protein
MAKKIAILVGERQDEALRVGMGLTLADDAIEVIVLDRKVASNDANDLNLETMNDMDVPVLTNFEGNEGMELISNEDIAKRLLDYDHVVFY